MRDETRIKIDKTIKVMLIVSSLLLVGSGVYQCFSRSSTTTDNNVSATMGAIKEQHEQIRSELEFGSREIEAAENHINGATGSINRSEEAAAKNARSTNEIEKLINECQEIVRSQRDLIQEVDGANGIGAQENK